MFYSSQTWSKSPDPVGPRSVRQGFALHRIRYANDTYITTGDWGLFFRNADLRGNWTFVNQIRDSGLSYQPMNSLAVGTGIYVIGGGSLEEQKPILYSPDTYSWYSAQSLPFDFYSWDIAFGGNAFVSVGDTTFRPRTDRQGVILFSPNGKTWSSVYNSTDADSRFFGAAYNNGMWVAVGSSIVTSKDGKRWAPIKNLPGKLTSACHSRFRCCFW